MLFGQTLHPVQVSLSNLVVDDRDRRLKLGGCGKQHFERGHAMATVPGFSKRSHDRKLPTVDHQLGAVNKGSVVRRKKCVSGRDLIG